MIFQKIGPWFLTKVNRVSLSVSICKDFVHIVNHVAHMQDSPAGLGNAGTWSWADISSDSFQ